jgi:hypothetical protein
MMKTARILHGKQLVPTCISSRNFFTIFTEFLRFFYASWRSGTKVYPWTTILGKMWEMLGTSQPPGPQFRSILVYPWDPKLAKIGTRPHGALSGGLDLHDFTHDPVTLVSPFQAKYGPWKDRILRPCGHPISRRVPALVTESLVRSFSSASPST